LLTTAKHFRIMINIATVVISFIFFILIKFLHSNQKKLQSNIPGPPSHPILSNFLTVSKLDPVPYRAWDSLTQAFGPVTRLILGNQFFCIIGGFKEIKEAMSNEQLDDRGSTPTADLLRFGNKETTEISFFSRGLGKPIDSVEKWKEVRRFTLKTLRDLGFGKSASEEAILEESKLLIENIKENLNGANTGIVDIEKQLNCAALNVIWNLVAGYRFQYNDAKMKEMARVTEEVMGMAKDVLGKPFGVLPFLRFFPPFKAKFKKLSKSFKDFEDFIRETVDEHEITFDKNNPRDFVDMFLLQIEADNSNIFNKKQLISTIQDLFIAGSETTSKSLQYAIAVLMRYPDIQLKLHENLDSIESDLITMSDKTQLSYAEATMNEVWRFCNIAPFGPPRHNSKATKIGDMVIPAESAIMYNTYSLHMNSDAWGDPENFRPERFLDDQGKYCHNEMLNPFGIGRRKCLGESLARMENFLFFANIFKKFKFSHTGEHPPSLEPDVGFTNGPFPFKAIVTLR